MKFYAFVSLLIFPLASARDYLDDWDVGTDGIRNSVIDKVNDGIGDCKDDTSTHSKFVTCVKTLVEKTNGLNSDEEDDIIEAARDSNVHRRSNNEDEDDKDEDREDRNEDKDEDDKDEDQEGQESRNEDEKSPDDSEEGESSSNGKRYLRSLAAKV